MAKNEMILCDTNIFIQFLNGREKVKNVLKKIGTESIALSIITYAELFYGTRKAEINAMKAFLDSFTILDIDAGISKVFRGLVLNYSYNYHLKIPDAFIAATAIHNGLQLYTENKKDFDFIPEIKLYKP
ncbi:MAG: type II toxin-antitoxin system VapC family toxin [Flavisolibacter sp.]|nr:type II toxin-antitoxin system VapC family toxin [Flavisolibacter sp.]